MILQIFPKYCINNDFNIIPERPIIQIFYINPYFVGEKHLIIVFFEDFPAVLIILLHSGISNWPGQ